MIESQLSRLILEALEAASAELSLEKLPDEAEISRPERKEFGDFSTNVAFQVAGQARRAPRQAAEAIVRHLPQASFVTSAEVAGAGFINFRVTNDWLYDVLRQVIDRGAGYGRGQPTGDRVQVEFVSANPSGPLHVGTARNAVLGDALANLLEAAGDSVEREYYFNDANRQMDLFGESVKELAAAIKEQAGDSLLDAQDRRERLQAMAVEQVLVWIRQTLDRLGV